MSRMENLTDAHGQITRGVPTMDSSTRYHRRHFPFRGRSFPDREGGRFPAMLRRCPILRASCGKGVSVSKGVESPDHSLQSFSFI